MYSPSTCPLLKHIKHGVL
ncbi:unnamed protein product [Spirodela intermedia]|uniref:Uncharacterized protein n=1 Tax=Spirodela intermedia TaxID=51605 RepID=A0A7I8KJJ1_SPIIN|nr:unnamed protein product [Spirodela intermedia]